jgi:hypothetical protein
MLNSYSQILPLGKLYVLLHCSKGSGKNFLKQVKNWSRDLFGLRLAWRPLAAIPEKLEESPDLKPK